MNWFNTIILSITTAIGSIFGVHHATVTSIISQPQSSSTNSITVDNTVTPSPTLVSDKQAIENIVTTALGAQKNITTFQDLQNMTLKYYSSAGIQKFQTMASKIPASSPTLENGIVSLFQKMPPPTITFTSVNISGGMATATIPFPGVTYGTMNGKPVGNPLKSILSVSLTKENDSWKINSLSEITEPATNQ